MVTQKFILSSDTCFLHKKFVKWFFDFPTQGIESQLLRWKAGILAIRPPENTHLTAKLSAYHFPSKTSPAQNKFLLQRIIISNPLKSYKKLSMPTVTKIQVFNPTYCI